MGNNQSAQPSLGDVLNDLNNLSKIAKNNQTYAQDVFNSIIGTKVYIRDRKWGDLIDIEARLRPNNGSPNQQWRIVRDGTAFRVTNVGVGWDWIISRGPNDNFTWTEPAAPGDIIHKWNISFSWNESAQTGGFVFTSVQWNKTARPDPSNSGNLVLTSNNANYNNPNNMIYWDIVPIEKDVVCANMSKLYAFNVPACRLDVGTTAYNDRAKAYCVQKLGGQCALMTNTDCQTWCNNNPGDCEAVMLQYCNANPGAAECRCIFADRQQDYKDFVSKYPAVSGSASCFTKACQTTNFLNQLIPKSIATTRCPDLTNIQQTSNQTLNVASGATVINPTLNSSQTAIVPTPKPVPQQQVTQSPAVNTVSATTNKNMLYFIIFVWMLMMISVLVYYGDDLFADSDAEMTKNTTKIAPKVRI